ncbi:MAG: polyphosphate kinase 2 family protein [Flavobacteriales bacterium]
MSIKYYSAFENISDSEYQNEKFRLQVELLKLQEWVLKENKRIAIVFEGRDAAGKGSAIKRIVENLMSKHHRVVELGSPTKKQNKSWFKTYEKRLPKNGEIVFFDRSWYSRAMVQPTMGYCTQSQYQYFMSKVNSWEKKLIKDGLIIIKFYLSIDKDTQLKRFHVRRNHLLKYWKLSKNDLLSLSKWKLYTYFKNQMFEKTSSKFCPWIVINANNKLTARLNAIRYMLENIEYDGKSNLQSSYWNIDKDRKKIKLAGVIFDNLTEEQYDLLSDLKQII